MKPRSLVTTLTYYEKKFNRFSYKFRIMVFVLNSFYGSASSSLIPEKMMLIITLRAEEMPFN